MKLPKEIFAHPEVKLVLLSFSERKAVEALTILALNAHQGNVTKAAAALEIHRATLHNRMRAMGLIDSVANRNSSQTAVKDT